MGTQCRDPVALQQRWQIAAVPEELDLLLQAQGLNELLGTTPMGVGATAGQSQHRPKPMALCQQRQAADQGLMILLRMPKWWQSETRVND